MIEPGIAYFQRAGEEEEFAHPHDGGDRCTSVGLSDTLVAALLGGDPALPARRRCRPRRTPISSLRRLGVTRAVDSRPVGTLIEPTRHEEHVLALVAGVLAAALPKRVAAGPARDRAGAPPRGRRRP